MMQVLEDNDVQLDALGLPPKKVKSQHRQIDEALQVRDFLSSYI
jgi:hypothetical protein